MEIGTALLIISHLFIFWLWSILYSESQVSDISINFTVNHMTDYDQLLVYYIVEHSCIIIVFITAAIMYFGDIIDFYKFDFFRANNDLFLHEILEKSRLPQSNDKFIKTYRKLLYIYLNQLITTETLQSCVKDEWLMSLLCLFISGDKENNIFYDTKLIQLLENGKDVEEMRGDIDNKTNNRFDIAIIPINDQQSGTDNSELLLPDKTKKNRLLLSQFNKYFNQKINKLTSCNIYNNTDIKPLLHDHITYSCKK